MIVVLDNVRNNGQNHISIDDVMFQMTHFRLARKKKDDEICL